MQSSKVASNLKKGSQITKMLKHFKTYNFINVTNDNELLFNFNGANVKEFIKNEWLLANMVMPDHPTFQIDSLQTQEDMRNAFKNVKTLVNQIPFSFIETVFSHTKDECSLPKPKNLAQFFSEQFKNKNGTILRNLIFYPPADASKMFYKKQQERKMWWKKFSYEPGRIRSEPVESSENNTLIMNIQVEFPWGHETVEVIKYLPEISENESALFEIKYNRKKCVPQLVTCEAVLENMTLAFLCDSYDAGNENSEKNVLKLHKNLAPFKVSFAGAGDTPESCKNLEDLALLLSKKLRKLGIAVLLLPDVCTATIDSQIIRNDSFGIPYTIILNEKTLLDGFIGLRNRDTTLQEQSHVSLIAEYMEKIVRSS